MQTAVEDPRLFCIVPAYRCRGTVCEVVARCLEQADAVVVVDDGCPEQTGQAVLERFSSDPRVHVVFRERNGGVGAAVKSGIAFAIEHDADVVVKIDGDGQMSAEFIPVIRKIFADEPALVCIKGNRFFDASVLRLMPKLRLFGNAVLSILTKFASGYWNVIDPTNGYLAYRLGVLKLLPWQSFANTYFFEISALCELGLKRLPILELEMPTIYTSAPSSLRISRVALEFPMKLLRLTLRRILVQYFVLDVNAGTLYLVFGLALLAFGTGFGAYQWVQTLITHVPRATGTVMLAVLPFLMGFQLVLNALMHDVQFAQRTSQELLVDLYRRHAKALRDDART